MKKNYWKYFFCFCLLSGCNNNPGKNDVIVRDTQPDTVTKIIPPIRNVVVPNSLQQKALNWYLSGRKGDSLQTIIGGNTAKFDSLRYKIYVDTTLYAFADLSFYEIVSCNWAKGWIEYRNSSRKMKGDSALLRNAIYLLSDSMILTAEDYLNKRNKYTIGDLHLTFSNVIFYNKHYFVQVWRVINEKDFFYHVIDTFVFDEDGKILEYLPASLSNSYYDRADKFIATMKKSASF